MLVCSAFSIAETYYSQFIVRGRESMELIHTRTLKKPAGGAQLDAGTACGGKFPLCELAIHPDFPWLMADL